MARISGYATADGTKAYADRMWAENPKLSPDGWRVFDGLTVAKIGLGTYRMAGQDQQTEAATQGLLDGVNLIDTAANYMGGQSEAWLGHLLGSLIEAEVLGREEIVLMTKAGYMQGDTLNSLRAAPPPQTAQFNGNLWHCIHPEFLARQLATSQDRLNVEALDVFLLHNPEYQLQHSVQGGMPLEEARKAFYAQITEAFTYLETACKEGKIRRYGVSSNTLGMPKDYEDFVDLAELVTCADAAAQAAWGRRKRSQFRVLQLPLNLLELGALKEVNTTQQTFDGPKPCTTLELASLRHMAVVANRPLNALLPNGQMLRLADPTANADTQLTSAAEELTEVEHALIQAADGQWPEDLPTLGYHWQDITNQLNGAVHTDQVCQSYLAPQAEEVIKWTEKTLKNEDLKGKYISAYKHFETSLKGWSLGMESTKLDPLREMLHSRLPQKWHGTPLHQLALNSIASTPGVSCVVSGMRHPSYIADATTLMEKGDFADAAQILGSAA